MAFNFAKSFQLPKEFNVDFQKLSTNLTSTVQGSIKEISKDVKDFSENFQPYTKNAIDLMKETIGSGISGDEVSALPPDYLLLERKADNLKAIYNRFLEVTQTYEIESYDYPPNIKESITDLSKTFSEKFQELSSASTTKEAEKILIKPSSNQSPKTLAHAIAKAAAVSRESLLKQVEAEEQEEDEEEDKEDSFAKVLLKLADTQKSIGSKRLEQDSLVINKFNSKIKEILDKMFKDTVKNRKHVNQSRYRLDHIRYEIKIAEEEQEKLKTSEGEDKKEEIEKHTKYLEDLNSKLEAAEDELVNSTIVAAKSMKKFLNPVESIGLIKILTTIQMNYFKAAAADLELLLKDIDEISESIEEEEEEEEEEQEEEEEEEA
ncbi:hypothetical protein DASC09_016980 [Saccharomycopsis crataegensis]|uniref:BAR domain-containing protein n=1 Tax=Saccharomycopsis crataegensis TaxID=43959 RepID=A0AAV5QHW3_9ASCO|nr:hypothetical protein DASC09_016980 [Saccharomycopsis crataegensis]